LSNRFYAFIRGRASSALVDSGAQTDRTTTLPVDANCQTTPINPTIVNVDTQTTYEQATAAVQTDSSNEECLHLLKVAEETAREEGYKRGKKEGFEVGVDVGLDMGEECGRSKERVEWNKYHGPDICVRTQVKKTNEATQTETPQPMELSTPTAAEVEPLDNKRSR
jgi:hypothetical protein